MLLIMPVDIIWEDRTYTNIRQLLYYLHFHPLFVHMHRDVYTSLKFVQIPDIFILRKSTVSEQNHAK